MTIKFTSQGESAEVGSMDITVKDGRITLDVTAGSVVFTMAAEEADDYAAMFTEAARIARRQLGQDAPSTLAHGLKVGDQLTQDSPEPPINTIVLDKTGDFWGRNEKGWHCETRLADVREIIKNAALYGSLWLSVADWAPLIVIELPESTS